MNKSKKQRIELMTTCTGWVRGYVTKILSQDDKHYYFNDEWDHWTTIEKSKEGIEFIIVGKEYPKAPGVKCGDREAIYDDLMEKTLRIKKLQDEN